MNDTKPWYTSQTIWGGVAAIGGGLGGAYYAFSHGDMGTVATCLTAAFGGITAIIGRFKADTAIGPKTVPAK